MDALSYITLARYKYQLKDDYQFDTGIKKAWAESEYVSLSFGLLTIKAGYCWNGASGGVFDTVTNHRAALVHDALYQLMGLGKLSRRHRKAADKIYRRICREDGMSWPRRQFHYYVLRLAGGIYARPE
ncbi:MAG: DUF1353 domain-containing protein [Phycisphaerae bacterium]|jgi:hypothetical protein